MEPVKVIAPTNIETDIETSLISDLKKSTFSKLFDIGKIATPKATKSDDIPPQPLNNATVSGMEVIGTFFARIAPNKLPMIDPIIIQIQD